MAQKIITAMSGGVDSAVAAILLREQGYLVEGVTMLLRPDPTGCGSKQDVADAAAVCETIGVRHHTVDLREEFQTNVMDYFTAEYRAGRTPNPCVVCNQTLKFGRLLDFAQKQGAEYISTGHYAEIKKNGTRWSLQKAPSQKDQSYVLYTMTQQQLSRTKFPLASYEKEQIRAIARTWKLPVAEKADSMDICFIPNGDYAAFLKKYAAFIPKEGDFIDPQGNVLGTHKGIIHYTVGQRKGLGVALGKPMYVTQIDPIKNTVTLAPEGGQNENKIKVENINWIAYEAPPKQFSAQVKIRYAAPPAPAKITVEGNAATVEFETPQRAPAPGQSAVFYKQQEVLGGGIITTP